MRQVWHEYIRNLERRFDEDMDGRIIINGIFACITNPHTLTKILIQYHSTLMRLVIAGNCDDAMYRIPCRDNMSPTQYWADLRDVNPDYLAKKITTGEAEEWYPEKYRSVFRERFAEKGEQFALEHVDLIDSYEEAVDRWNQSDYDFTNESPWDMGAAPSIKVYMHAAALRAIGRKAQESLNIRAKYAKV